MVRIIDNPIREGQERTMFFYLCIDKNGFEITDYTDLADRISRIKDSYEILNLLQAGKFT